MSVRRRAAASWILLCLTWVWAFQARGDDSSVRETVRAVYRLYYGGLPMGEVSEQWQRDGGHYHLRSEAHPYPVVRWLAPSFTETSDGLIVDGFLRPERFVHRRSDDPQPMIADFRWEQGVLVHHFDGKTETLPLDPHTQDMQSIKYLYRAGDAWIDRDLPMSTGKRLELHHFVLQDTPPLATEAGRFETRHLVDQNGEAPSHFEIWLPTDRRYPPVRMQVTERGHRWEQRLLRVEFQ
ncbi:MAG: DUF3108 domain-containing protein [Betaproteobacteria bacterium]|nr:DUF3108 domain-containing protein [Betaproteobacteria bacterium]MDE2622274.1 DUF3108 domain-containing protein [Betaproteobacteria bacterium]